MERHAPKLPQSSSDVREPRRFLPGSKAPRIAMLCGKGAAAPLSYADGPVLTVMFGPQETENVGLRALHLEQGWCQLNFPSMHTSTQYGTFAEECDRLAKEAQAERHRMVLKEMAEAWRKLAEEADRIGEQPRR